MSVTRARTAYIPAAPKAWAACPPAPAGVQRAAPVEVELDLQRRGGVLRVRGARGVQGEGRRSRGARRGSHREAGERRRVHAGARAPLAGGARDAGAGADARRPVRHRGVLAGLRSRIAGAREPALGRRRAGGERGAGADAGEAAGREGARIAVAAGRAVILGVLAAEAGDVVAGGVRDARVGGRAGHDRGGVPALAALAGLARGASVAVEAGCPVRQRTARRGGDLEGPWKDRPVAARVEELQVVRAGIGRQRRVRGR